MVSRLLDLRAASEILVAHNAGVAAARRILPELDRNRLIVENRVNAEFSIERDPDASSGTALYAANIYNTTLWAIERRNPGENPYAAIYDETAFSEPVARSDYDIYIDYADQSLVYIKEPCARPVARDGFFLLVFPERAEDLPDADRHTGRANRSFTFYDFGSAFNGKCVAKVPLPDYDIAAIRTGQLRTVDDPRWEAAFPYQDPSVYKAGYVAAASIEPDSRAEFNVYRSEDKPALAYLREPCGPSDVEHPFFIHITPERESDLPTERKQYGFDNWGFDFLLHGIVFDGKCFAEAPLPDYPIASLRTGQFIRGEGEVWEATILAESP